MGHWVLIFVYGSEFGPAASVQGQTSPLFCLWLMRYEDSLHEEAQQRNRPMTKPVGYRDSCSLTIDN